MRPRLASVRIDTKKNHVEVDRGWPIEGHGTAGEVMALLYVGTVGLVAGMVQMFPNHKKTMAEFFRTVASVLEDESPETWDKWRSRDVQNRE